MAAINIDYYRPAAAPSHGDDRIRCAGTEGVIEVRENKIFLINKDGTQTFDPTEAPDLVEEFLDGRVTLSPEEIFYITRVSLAAREAADTGKTVQIER